MVEVVNRQRRRKVDGERWREFAEEALAKIGVEGDVTIAFVSDRVMRDLNRRFRGRKSTTDVLSFPWGAEEFEKSVAAPMLGEVVISLERAAAQSAEHEIEFEEEVAQLILHGLLHLCDYDHETDDGEMDRLELRLRRRLGI